MGILKMALIAREKKQKDLIHDALKEARRVSGMLIKRFGASEVKLYGSLLEKEHFEETSDIDLAVKGLGDRYLGAFGYCLRMSEYNLDIRQYEDLPERIKSIIDEKGLKLYG